MTDSTTIHQHTDRRLLQKERHKKIALGHKGNDKESCKQKSIAEIKKVPQKLRD